MYQRHQHIKLIRDPSEASHKLSVPLPKFTIMAIPTTGMSLLHIILILYTYYTRLNPTTHKNMYVYLHLYSRAAIQWKIVIFFNIVIICTYDQNITIIITTTTKSIWCVISIVFILGIFTAYKNRRTS